MMFSVPAEDYEVDPELVKVMNLLLILHADHEQNCSTSTVRVVGSSRRPTSSRRSARASARSGARSTAAPTRKCSRCSTAIHADGGDVDKYVELAKDKNSNFKLMGFGHRVYKNFDPRAKIIKSGGRQGAHQARQAGPAARHREGARGGGAQGQLLRRAQALPERRLLLGHHLPGDGLPDEHVHRALRARPPSRAGSPTGRR